MEFAKHCINAWMTKYLNYVLVSASESHETNDAFSNICFNLLDWLAKSLTIMYFDMLHFLSLR